MLKTTVEVTNPGLIAAHAQVLLHAPEVANKLIADVVNQERDRLLVQFRKEPPPAAHPIIWTSERQRRAYFASGGFGGGIPSTRKHALVNAWRLIVVYEPGRITRILLENADPARPYVIGRQQQKMHLVTGWYQEAPLIQRSARLVTGKVETALIRSFYAIEGR
jgi:hypothetical protein